MATTIHHGKNKIKRSKLAEWDGAIVRCNPIIVRNDVLWAESTHHLTKENGIERMNCVREVLSRSEGVPIPINYLCSLAIKLGYPTCGLKEKGPRYQHLILLDKGLPEFSIQNTH